MMKIIHAESNSKGSCIRVVVNRDGDTLAGRIRDKWTSPLGVMYEFILVGGECLILPENEINFIFDEDKAHGC